MEETNNRSKAVARLLSPGLEMTQMLLLPDPRPLVERLGIDFFRNAPDCPGVYLMRDAADAVVYVGKAKNLRKRLGSYRVANPDRLRRRQLRLLHAVARVDFELCADESGAIAREAELLLSLRPRFNRAGTWPGPVRFLAWRLTEEGLSVAVFSKTEPRQKMDGGGWRMEDGVREKLVPSSALYPGSGGVGAAALSCSLDTADHSWRTYGPLGAGVFALRAALVRLIWAAVHREAGIGGMPEGWFHGRVPESATVPRFGSDSVSIEQAAEQLEILMTGRADEFAVWIRERTVNQNHPFEAAVRDTDLEAVTKFANRRETTNF